MHTLLNPENSNFNLQETPVNQESEQVLCDG